MKFSKLRGGLSVCSLCGCAVPLDQHPTHTAWHGETPTVAPSPHRLLTPAEMDSLPVPAPPPADLRAGLTKGDV